LACEVAPITSLAEAREVLGPPLHRAVFIRVDPVVLLPLFHRVNPWLKSAEIIFALFASFCGQTNSRVL
jgi:hypothetical protein